MTSLGLKEAKDLYTRCSAKSKFLELSQTFLLDITEFPDIQKVRVVFSVGPEYNDQGYDLSLEVRQFTYIEKSGKKIDGNTSEVYDWGYSWCLEDLAVFLQYAPDISFVQEVEFVIEDFPAFCKLLEATHCNPSFGALEEAITHKYLGKQNFY